MRSWRPLAFGFGVVIALAGLAVGVYFNQSIIALVSILVALFTALSPTVVPTLSDEIQGNNGRYERHREYFANVILPTAGSMETVYFHSVRLLPPDRLAWKIAEAPAGNFLPGQGEHRIPAYEEVYLAHLEAKDSDPVWGRMRSNWNSALAAVGAYTTARRAFDSELFSRMDALIGEKVGKGFQPAWDDIRGPGPTEPARRYQAAEIRDCLEHWFDERYGKSGWQWHGPAVATGNALGGASWAITSGGSSNAFLWGGPIPTNLLEMTVGMTEVIEVLRNDSRLKGLYQDSRRREQLAREAVAPLAVAAFDAANLLRHGPDIPGDCSYCRKWRPRF